MTTETHDHFTTSKDGLRLYARRWGPLSSTLTPVVCLPGLSRNSTDFDDIAPVLTAGGRRTVYAFDYRGRGRSDYDPTWANYDVKVEIVDVMDQLTHLGIQQAVFFGTSRGGLLTLLVALLRPAAVKGAVLNDIGPKIETAGLLRIKSYVGKLPTPASFAEGAAALKAIGASQFPLLSDAQWETQARRTWKNTPDGLVLQYDSALMRTLEALTPETPLPDLWPQFAALAKVPLLVLRGALSDILSPETAAAMAARHPDCRVLEVPNEGHAPFLGDAPTQQAVAAFVDRIDRANSASSDSSQG